MSKKLRVLHVVGAMNKGGTETMLMNLYRNLDREKIQFDFISFSKEEAYYDKEIELLGGKVIRLELLNPVHIKKSINQIYNVINTEGPYDVVHAHTLFNSGIAMIAAKKKDVKIRISHAHTTLNVDNSFVRRIYSNIMRYFINNYSTNLLSCSEAAGKFLFGEKCYKSNKYSYIPNLIDADIMYEKPTGLVEKFKVENNLNNHLVLGHIGTFKDSKNQKFLIEITKFLVEHKQKVKLLLVGDGSMRMELEELTSKYNIEDNVIFTGIRDDINVMLHSMDLFIFPSIYEGLGLVLLEAQAAGLHCLVSEAIQPEADLKIGLVSRLNLSDGVEVWAEKILDMKELKYNNLEEIMSAFNKTGYSKNNCINRLLDIYEFKK